jgi:hypothetical protein
MANDGAYPNGYAPSFTLKLYLCLLVTNGLSYFAAASATNKKTFQRLLKNFFFVADEEAIKKGLARDKRSSLFWSQRQTRRRKGFYESDTCGQCYKTFYGRKLRLFIIS